MVRWLRRSLVLAVSALVAFAGWLHQAGLPGFLKAPLLAQLRQRGVAVEFDRVRLRLTRGIVAEKVRAHVPADGPGLRVRADDVEVRLRWARLLQGRAPEVTALVIKGGHVEAPIGAGDDPGTASLPIHRISARVTLEGTQTLRIDELSAHALRGTFIARGTVTNAGNWIASRRTSRPDPGVEGGRWREHVRSAIRWMDATRFDEPPEVTVEFHADMGGTPRASMEARVRAAGISNAWLRAGSADVRASWSSPPGATSAAVARARVTLDAIHLAARGATLASLRASAELDADTTGQRVVRAKWRLEGTNLVHERGGLGKVHAEGITEPAALGGGAEAPWGLPPETGPWAAIGMAGPGFRSMARLDVADARALLGTNTAGMASMAMELHAEHSLAGWREARVDMALGGLRSTWTGLAEVRLDVGMAPNPRPPATDASWEYLRRLAYLDAWGNMEADGMELPKVRLDGASMAWTWIAPWFDIGPFEARFGGGKVTGEGEMDVSSRRGSAVARSDADPRGIAPWLAPSARAQLTNYAWPTGRPPRFHGAVGIQLPRWSAFDKPTREATLASLTLDAGLDVGPVRFRDIPFDRASGRVTYTNRVWRIGPLGIVRPEGKASLQYDNDERTRDYHFTFTSALSPGMIGPLLDEKGRRELERFTSPAPPRITGEAWGRWGSPELVGVRAHVTATNMVVRGEPIEWADGDVTFTNRVLAFANVRARSDGDVLVPGATFDTGSMLLSFTNARATIPVWRVTRIIGPKTAKTMEPYRFAKPPRSLVNGVVHVRGGEGTDIRFDITADEFAWWRLRATPVTAGVRLVGDTLRIEGLRAGFYGGDLGGSMDFDWSGPARDAGYKLDLALTNVALRDFLADTWQGTNRLEGIVSGHGKVTSGRTSDPGTVNGEGTVAMRDGYLWGLPVFGFFSPLLDAISPGLGQARFTSGTASYVLTNGVIRTKDLEMRSAAMRLAYGGTVDLGGKLDATMQAELFRDAPLIGQLLSLALSPVTKLFEYEVKGTLGNPLPEPRYIPRFVMIFLKPTSVLRELFAPPPKGPEHSKARGPSP